MPLVFDILGPAGQVIITNFPAGCVNWGAMPLNMANAFGTLHARDLAMLKHLCLKKLPESAVGKLENLCLIPEKMCQVTLRRVAEPTHPNPNFSRSVHMFFEGCMGEGSHFFSEQAIKDAGLTRTFGTGAKRAAETIVEQAGQRATAAAAERGSVQVAERASVAAAERASAACAERASLEAAERATVQFAERASEIAVERASVNASAAASKTMLDTAVSPWLLVADVVDIGVTVTLESAGLDTVKAQVAGGAAGLGTAVGIGAGIGSAGGGIGAVPGALVGAGVYTFGKSTSLLIDFSKGKEGESEFYNFCPFAVFLYAFDLNDKVQWRRYSQVMLEPGHSGSLKATKGISFRAECTSFKVYAYKASSSGLSLSWMYADCNALAYYNAGRWSSKKPFDATMIELADQNEGFARPIRIIEYVAEEKVNEYVASSQDEVDKNSKYNSGGYSSMSAELQEESKMQQIGEQFEVTAGAKYEVLEDGLAEIVMIGDKLLEDDSEEAK